MCKLHGDEGLTWKTLNSPRLIINLDSGQLHIKLGLNKVPLIVIEWHRGGKCHIKDAITNHKYKHKVTGGWKKEEDKEMKN